MTTKEPWQMTRAEWFEHGVEYVTEIHDSTHVSAVTSPNAKPRKPRTHHLHIFAIMQAKRRGETIPAEVLESYPDVKF